MHTSLYSSYSTGIVSILQERTEVRVSLSSMSRQLQCTSACTAADAVSDAEARDIITRWIVRVQRNDTVAVAAEALQEKDEEEASLHD